MVATCPATVISEVEAWRGRGIVEVPTTSPELPRAIGVPAIVSVGSPILIVVPAIANSLRLGFKVATCPARVMTESADWERRGIIDVPTISPLEPNETGVPEIVMAGEFVASVFPAITTALGRMVTAWPAAVITESED